MDFKAESTTGEALLMLLIKRDADDFFFDFNDSTFKAAGWTDIDAIMTEINAAVVPGEYEYSVVVTSWNDGVYSYYFKYTGVPAWVTGGEFRLVDGKEAIQVIGELGTSAKANVNTEADTALSDIKLDHLVAVAESDEPVDNSIIAKLAAVGADWSTFDKVTDSLQAVRDRGDTAWITATGFATPTNVTDSQTAIIAQIDANETKIDTIDTNIDSVLADTNELQAELADGGRTDLLIDGIKAKTDNLPADPADDSDIDTQLADLHTHITTLLTHNVGAGATAWTYTLTEAITGLPIADADVWVTSDVGGSNVLASGKTNQSGVVTFYLDAGTIYVWRQKSGWDFTNPDSEVL